MAPKSYQLTVRKANPATLAYIIQHLDLQTLVIEDTNLNEYFDNFYENL